MSTPQESCKNTVLLDPSTILILGKFQDHRSERPPKHHLTDILFIALFTVICGGESFEDMEIFGKSKEPWLRQYLE